jgi:hypothetical protein
MGGMLKHDFERPAGVLKALAGLGFAEQALMDGFAAYIIDTIGGLEKGRVDASKLEVIVDLMEQIT